MTISLNRKHLVLLSLDVVIIGLFLFRMNYLLGGSKTNGVVVDVVSWSNGSYRNRGTYTAPIIKFSVKKLEYTFQGGTNIDLHPGAKIQVIYEDKNPNNASVYTFFGFWFVPILCSAISYFVFILPLIFSFINKNEVLFINFDKGFKVSKKIIE